MTVLTISVARKFWLTMVSDDANSNDVRREIVQQSEPEDQIVFLGFEDGSQFVEQAIASIPSDYGNRIIPAFTEEPHTAIDNFIKTTSKGSFTEGRVVIPYQPGPFMTALWGIGAAWDDTFLAEWELLLDKTIFNARLSFFPGGRLLHAVFQASLTSDSAPLIADALQKILTMSSMYDAAYAAILELAPYEP